MSELEVSTFQDFLRWESSTDDTVDFKKVYVDIASGDIVSGLLLSQIVYWHLPSKRTNKVRLRVKKEGNLWLAKGRDDWYDECRISARQFDRASKILVDLGILEKKVFKFSGVPTVHVRIIQDKFIDLLNKQINEQYVEELAGEDEWVNEERTLYELAEDAGCTPHDTEPHFGETMREAESDLETLNSSHESVNSINREDPTLFNSNELNRDVVEEPTPKCSVCGARDPVHIDIDKHGRCAVCLLVDGWTHFVGKRTPSYSVNDKTGMREYVGVDNIRKLDIAMRKRLKQDMFRRAWIYSLKRASQMDHLINEGFFTPEYFTRNDENWVKIIRGAFDGLNRDSYPESDRRLRGWLAGNPPPPNL